MKNDIFKSSSTKEDKKSELFNSLYAHAPENSISYSPNLVDVA